MDLKKGSTLGMIGSLIVTLSFVIVIVVGLWIVAWIYTNVPAIASQNGTVNSTALNNAIANENVGQIGGAVAAAGITYEVLEFIGIIIIGFAFSAFGRQYKNDKISKYGYWGTILIVISILLSIAGAYVTFLVISVVSFVALIAGFILYMFALKEIATNANYKTIQYYGYGLVIGGVLQLVDGIGIIVLIVVFALLAFGFRKIGMLSTEVNPFEQKGTQMAGKSSSKHRKRN